MPRFALTRAVDRVDDDDRRAAAEPADLLRDDRHVEVAEAGDDRVLGRLVDRGRLVAAEAGADDRLALDAGRQLLEHALHVRDRGATDGEPVGHSGRKSRPEVSFGVEEGALLRHHVAAAGDRPDVLDPRRPQQEGGLGLAAVDRRDRLARMRRVRDALRREPVDELRVEPLALEQLVAALPVEDESRQVITRLVDRRAANPVDRLREPVRGEDRQPLLVGRDDHASSQADSSVPSSAWKASVVS